MTVERVVNSRDVLNEYIKRFPKYPVNYRVVSKYVAKVGGWFDAEIRECLRRWDTPYKIDNSKLYKVFPDIKFHDAFEAATQGVLSMIEHGYIKKR